MWKLLPLPAFLITPSFYLALTKIVWILSSENILSKSIVVYIAVKKFGTCSIMHIIKIFCQNICNIRAGRTFLVNFHANSLRGK